MHLLEEQPQEFVERYLVKEMRMQGFSARVLTLAVVGNLVLSSQAKAISNSSLTVAVSGMRNQKGQVCLSLFSEDQGFPSSNERALDYRCVKAEKTPLAVKFSNLSPGSYAVAVFHDENEDGILNRGFLGIPKEGFGFSRNPKILTGPPSFKDAAILVTEPNTEIQIQLEYF